MELPLRVQRLVAFLALRGRPLQRAYVAGRLWLDASQEHAYGSLRATIWEARRLHCPFVQASNTQVALAPQVRVDAEELEQCAARVLHGDGFPQLHELRLLALESAAETLIAAGRTSEASIAAFAAISAEPLRESSCCLLARACLAAGNRVEADRHLAEFRARLRRQCGLEPSPRMRELILATSSKRLPRQERPERRAE